MRSPFFHGVGGVVSADIAVPEHERELDFYRRVLTTGSAPLWRDDLTNNQGMPVIGLGFRTPEYEVLPLQWFPHFQVADVATSAARAVELGGRELMHGRDDDGQSQWAGLVDPGGAAFGVIPVVDEPSPDPGQLGDIGHIARVALLAEDVASMSSFYEQVVGLAADTAEIAASDEFKSGIGSVWLIHLPVDNFAESLRQVDEGGGEVVWQPTDEERAVIRDPVGVYFALTARSS
ncbi:MAG: VOC family protein [Planctomycetota bacterium]